MLGVSGLQDATLSPIRRVWVTLALAIRCLQEALFVAISVTIVAAAKVNSSPRVLCRQAHPSMIQRPVKMHSGHA